MAAIVVPVVFSTVAGSWSAIRSNFVSGTIRTSSRSRDYFNSSIQGNGIYYGLPIVADGVLLRIAFHGLAIASRGCSNRYRTRDPLFWMATSSGVALRSVVSGAVAAARVTR